MVPNKKDFVKTFLTPRLKKLATTDETRANSFEALNALCIELRKEDANWGLLEKTGGSRVRNRAADVLVYALGTECQVIDVIGDAEGADGTPKPSWQLKDLRPISQWKVPFDEPKVPAEPKPEPKPEPDPLEPRVAELERKLAALLKKLADGVPVSREVFHSHVLKFKIE